MRFKWLSAGALAISAITAIAAIADDKPAPSEAVIPPAAAQTQPAAAQSQPPASPPTPAPAAAATPAPAATAPAQTQAAATAAQTAPKLGQEQLDQLLAPVALYPDQLLGQVLMASTYPLEVVEAARWVHEPAHRSLHGDALFAAMKEKGWDPSVMALVPFDRVLQVMNDRLDWMRDLGAAFVAQQGDVMAEVQRLRHLAVAAGNLKQTPACHCIIGTQGETITIAAAESGPICLPTYNTHVAYGRWPYPSYPPMVFPAPVGVVWVPGIPIGYYPVVDLAWAGPLWGWDRIDWAARHIIVDSGRYALLAARDPGFAGGVWRFDPARRGAVTALGVAAGVRAAGIGIAAPAGATFAARGAIAGATAFRGGRSFAGGRAFGRPGPVFAARSAGRFAAASAAPHFAGHGRFGGMAALGGRGGGHFGAAHFGGFGGGRGHFGGPASFGLGGGGGGHHGGGGGGHHGR